MNRFVSAALVSGALALALSASGAFGSSVAASTGGKAAGARPETARLWRAGAAGPTPAVVASLAKPGPVSPLARERIYFVLTDRYVNGNPSNDTGGHSGGVYSTGYDPTSTGWWHGGDFKGLKGGCTTGNGLARIKALGFNAVWVSPPVVNQIAIGSTGGYHGYWGTDFMHVDPHLGTDQDFANFVACAHSLGLKVIQDIVLNHTGDVIQLPDPGNYHGGAYRDCHGQTFDPQKYVGTSTFPCLSANHMPQEPSFLSQADAHLKNPAWLNDPLNYHDRGNINFSGCSPQCLGWGDFFGLDDLFTEKPSVEKGLAAIYASWITRFHVDGFRVDTAPYVNSGFFKLWVPQIMTAAKAAGVPNFQIFGEVYNSDPFQQMTYVRDDGMPNLLDFPFQSGATAYVAGQSSALAVSERLEEDDYARLPDGSDPAPATFLGNHDMGRAAYQILTQNPGLSPAELLRRVKLGYDLMYFTRGAPVVYYGDEVGMIGTGGDQQAREDMFPTQVTDWQTQPRVGSPAIGTGSSFADTTNPIALLLPQLSQLRAANPALAYGATFIRYSHHGVLAMSRIDAAAKREYVVVTNSATAPATITFPTSTPSSSWSPLFGGGSAKTTGATGKLTVTVPAIGALVFKAAKPIAVTSPPKPQVHVFSDPWTNLFDVAVSVTGTQPLTVAFAVKRAGSSTWRRLDVDDSAPYRGFLDPLKYKSGEQLSVVAIARNLNGSTATSAVVTYTLPKR